VDFLNQLERLYGGWERLPCWAAGLSVRRVLAAGLHVWQVAVDSMNQLGALVWCTGGPGCAGGNGQAPQSRWHSLLHDLLTAGLLV